MHSDTLFTGVRIVADGVDLLGDLLVRDGVIADFGASLGRPDGAVVVQEDGAVLCPGLVDMRVAVGRAGVRISRNDRLGLRRRIGRRDHNCWPRCRTASRRSTIRLWCIC